VELFEEATDNLLRWVVRIRPAIGLQMGMEQGQKAFQLLSAARKLTTDQGFAGHGEDDEVALHHEVSEQKVIGSESIVEMGEIDLVVFVALLNLAVPVPSVECLRGVLKLVLEELQALE